MWFVRVLGNEGVAQARSFNDFDKSMIIESITDPKLLLEELEKATDLEYRFRLCYRLSYLFLSRAPKRSLHMAKALVLLAKDIDTPKTLGMAYTAMARYYQHIGDYKHAMTLYGRAYSYLEGEGLYIEKAKVLDGMGMLHSYIGEHAEAIARSEDAIRCFDLGNDKLGMKANSMNNIGNAYGRVGNVEESVRYYKMALDVIKEYGQEKNSTNIRANMAIQMNKMGRSEEAMVELRQCFDEFKLKGYKKGMALAMQNMALCHAQLGEYGEAVELFIRSMMDLKQLNYQEAMASGHKGLANTYLAMKGYREAANELLEAIEIYTKLGLVNELVESLDLLGTVYSEQGKLDLAKETWNRALDTLAGKDMDHYEQAIKDKLAGLAK